MPAPKDPVKYQEWKNKLRLVAKLKGFGKWMKGRHNSRKTEFHRGHVPLHKGTKRPGIGGRKKGGVAWNKNIPYTQIQGENHWNYKGGITPKHRTIRNSIEFHIWRNKVFLHDEWTCWICGKYGGLLHPHHLLSFSRYPELRFSPNNGVTLCKFCHYTYGNHQR